MFRIAAFLLGVGVMHAAGLSLEQLYRRPFIWGTPPTEIKWSKEGHALAFLWNGEGKRFKDLYAYNPDTQKLIRLTDLENVKDELNAGEAAKDERLRRYLLPQAGLESFELSRDGRKAAFSHKGDLFVVQTDGATPPLRLTRTKASESSPTFSSDGKTLASVRAGQIMVQDLTNGQIWQATDIEGATLVSYKWSPDGKWFLYVVRKGSLRQLPLPNYSGRFVTARPFTRTVAGDEAAESAMFLASADGGKPREVNLGDWGGRAYQANLEWSPDSKKILLARIHQDKKRRQVQVIDVDTAKAATVFEERDERFIDYGAALWSPDSQSLLFTSDKDGWSHLYRVAAAGGDPVRITKGSWEVRTESFSEDPQWIGDWIYFASTEGDTAQRHFYRIRADGSEKERLSNIEGLNIGLRSEDGRFTAWRRADVKNPFDLWVGDHRVTQSPRPEFYKYPWPERRYVTFPSRGDKKVVAAQLLLPPGYRPEDRSQKPRPAVVYIHGAGVATSVLKQWGSYNELRYVYNAFLAARGCAVLDLDYRGSTGYGRDWRTGVYLHMGGPDLEDVLGGVDYLKSLGNIDMSRIGIWGVSYGGFMTNMALFLAPGTFRAGASWAAVNDWHNYNETYTTQRLNTPASNPEAYRRSSPITFSHNLRDKLLIVHGMVDDNVLFQDAVQLTEKLIQEGKDFGQIFYPQESHAFVRDETWIDALRRTTEWFERYLQ
jgi:dipeptidyl aminopeptidase/acylaminoacyl peptidase